MASGTPAAPHKPEGVDQPFHTTPSGLKYKDILIGTGPEPKAGENIGVHYTGTLEDGTEFDSSRKRGQPIYFNVGTGMAYLGSDAAANNGKHAATHLHVVV
jgi:peptidylprolyl isomerase